jgi:hypothetical protein
VQDEDGNLARRQDLQGRHEGQGDRFGPFVADLRARRHVDHTLEDCVGNRLEPHDFTEACRLGRFHIGHVPLLGGASAGQATHVQAPVGGDPIKPRAERSASLESSDALPCGQQRFLHRVLRVLEGPEYAVAVHQQLATVRPSQLPERLAVAGSRPRNQVSYQHVLQYGHRPTRKLGVEGAPSFSTS